MARKKKNEIAIVNEKGNTFNEELERACEAKDEGVREINVKTTMEPPFKIGVVANCKRVNIRRARSKVSKVVDIYDEGKEILVRDPEKGFFEVVDKDGNVIGYVMTEFVNVIVDLRK